MVNFKKKWTGVRKKTSIGRRWIKTYVKRGGIVAGYARELKEIKEFDDGFFFKLNGKKYRQPLMVNV